MIGEHHPPGTLVQCTAPAWLDPVTELIEEYPDLPREGGVYSLERYYRNPETGKMGIYVKGCGYKADPENRRCYALDGFRLLPKPRKRKALPESIVNFLDTKSPITGDEIEKRLRPKRRPKRRVSA